MAEIPTEPWNRIAFVGLSKEQVRQEKMLVHGVQSRHKYCVTQSGKRFSKVNSSCFYVKNYRKFCFSYFILILWNHLYLNYSLNENLLLFSIYFWWFHEVYFSLLLWITITIKIKCTIFRVWKMYDKFLKLLRCLFWGFLRLLIMNVYLQ